MKRAEQTKTELAAALKELTQVMPLCKISVSDIVDHVGMSRKSFYYHFRDKYDLVARVFDMEFLHQYQYINSGRLWFEELCRYLYEERAFYRNVLAYDGQNSFREYLGICICARISLECGRTAEEILCAQLLSDAVLAMIERWLTEYKDLDADGFLALLDRSAAWLGIMGGKLFEYRSAV